MSTYVPVAGKRYALKIYRDRRRGGGDPFHEDPRPPITAMRETVHFFEGWLAVTVDEGNVERQKTMLDGYRAAQKYLNALYAGDRRSTRRVMSYRELEDRIRRPAGAA